MILKFPQIMVELSEPNCSKTNYVTVCKSIPEITTTYWGLHILNNFFDMM